MLLGTLICLPSMAWNPAGNTIRTRWAKEVTPDNVWKSYPRPQLKRQEWQNLNGLWKFSITNSNTTKEHVEFNEEILVPFSVESSLSGICKPVLPEDRLWYRKDFTLEPGLTEKNIILHFGAVDYECDIWVNGKYAGNHKGGNNPFSFDITRFIKGHGKQILEIKVSDPTDTESVTRGKQQLHQKGIWYTPVSGIWKTVWLEAVADRHIESIRPETDIYNGKVNFNIKSTGKGNEMVEVEVFDKGTSIAKTISSISGQITVTVPDHICWTPQTPKLYTVRLKLGAGGKVYDEVESYFAFRKVSIVEDNAGYKRIGLNDKPLFQFGTLDQGWWPDGLLTPPSERAMLWDMLELKKMGFNTIRKHIKVEPELYYYYADSLGLMIWQDMVSGFATGKTPRQTVGGGDAKDWDAPASHVQQWESELFCMIDQLGFYPSITTWVIFNEGWGQHNTVDIVKKVMDYDKTRIINGVSGWTDRKVGDVLDVHNYPMTSMILPANNGGRISVLGEFGGFGLPLQGHLWNPEMRNWGYKNIDGGLDLAANYSRVVYDLETLAAQGLAAAIYTQTTDVEGEVNGLISYDREIVKMPADYLHMINSRLYGIEGKRAISLVSDGQDGIKSRRMVEYDGASKEIELPVTLSGKKTFVSECSFMSYDVYENISLWLSMPGQVKVWLNGTLVFDRENRQTGKYNQYNISDYAAYLKIGSNTLRVELRSSADKNFRFDYGLRAF